MSDTPIYDAEVARWRTPIYDAEVARLEARYWKAVGEALYLRILVYHPGTGGMMKSLGELEDEITRTLYGPEAAKRRRDFEAALFGSY